MKQISILGISLLILLMMATSTNALTMTPEQLQSFESPFNYKTTVDFSPADVKLIPKSNILSNNTFSQTVEKTVWQGGPQLILGYPTTYLPSFSRLRENFSLSVDVTQLQSSKVRLTLTYIVDMFNIMKSSFFSTSMEDRLMNTTVKLSYYNSTEYTRSLGNSYYSNSTHWFPDFSYYNILHSSNIIIFSRLVVYLSTIDNLPWNSTASLTFNLQGIHNPKLYEMSLQRLQRLTNRSVSSIQSLSTTPTSSKIRFTPLSFSAVLSSIGFLATLIYLKRYKKHK